MATIAEGAPAAPVELRILTPDGHLLHDRDPSLSTEHLRPIYEAMVRARWLDARLAELHRQGRIGFHAASPGDEAATVASAAALRPADGVFLGRRELGVLLWRGASAQRCLDGAFGNASDGSKGRSMPGLGGSRASGVVGGSGLLANHLIHAVGWGWAGRIDRASGGGEPSVAAAYFHEIAADAADFHTALNFAGVFRVPVVFVGRNRGDKGALASKAVAYGLDGALCDGLDALAVLAATGRARERALSGKGATLLELHTPDAGPDPLDRARRFLERQGAWGAEAQTTLEGRIEAEVAAAITQAEKAPAPPAASLFDDVYALPPWHLIEQRAALLGGGNPGDR